MATLIYAPEVRVYIDSEHDGLIDVSNDLVQGSMTRRSDGVSTFDFAITNARRKYDLKFTPNDRIVCLMKRVSWLQTFSGYLNSVPLRSAWPQDVTLSASCSLKKLQYYWWDPLAMDSIALMYSVASMTNAKHGVKSGTGLSGNLMVAVMTKVAGWPKGNIHLGEVPTNWMQLAVQIAAQVAQWGEDEQNNLAEIMQNMGGGAILQGSASERIQDIVNNNGDQTGSTDTSGLFNVNTLGGIPAPASGGAYSAVMVAAILYAAGFRGNGLWQGVAICLAESSGRPSATNKNTDGSIDRGMWQINSVHLGEISQADMFDPVKASQWAYKASKGGTNWEPWSTNNNQVQFVMNSPAGKQATIAKQAVQQLPTLIKKEQATKKDLATSQAVAGVGLSLIGAPKGLTSLVEKAIGSSAKSDPAAVISSNPELNNLTAGSDGGITTGMTGGNGITGHTGYDLAHAAAVLITKWPAIPYVYGANPNQPPILGSSQPSGFDCSSLVLYCLNQILGKHMASPRTALAQYQSSQAISVKQALNTPGALLFSSYSTIGAIDHVVICMGDGSTIIEAPHTGAVVRQAQALQDTAPGQKWVAGGLIRYLSYPANQSPVGVGLAGAGSSPALVPVKSGGTGIWPVAKNTVGVGYQAGLPTGYTAGKFPKTPTAALFENPYSLTGTPVLDSSYVGSATVGLHSGIDFDQAKYGDPVKSVTTGTVVVAGTGPESSAKTAGTNGWFGKYVCIQSGNTRVYYANLATTSVTVGQKIKAGKVIGTVGNSAKVFPTPSGSGDHTSGVHLHFEVRKGDYSYNSGNLVDPVEFITKGVSVAPPGTSPAIANDPNSAFYRAYDQSPLYDANSPVDALFGNQPWVISADMINQATYNNSFQGAYALAKGSVVLQYVQQMCASTMRSYCSAPNGDFIAWFPDYYGIWGSSAILDIQTIELMDFNMIWTDDNFVTHQFVQPLQSAFSIDPTTGIVSGTSWDLAQEGAADITAGIANIDSPIIMAALFGFPPDNAENFANFIYKKFGARPNVKQVNIMFTDKSQEFFMALYYFMLQWAYQYQASVPITFMPEAWPGMLIQVKAFNFQAYITSVTHTFQFGPNGSFNTQINICAPALLNGGSKQNTGPLIGLPIAGGYLNSQVLDTTKSPVKAKKSATKPKAKPKITTKTSGRRK